jgi:transcriptional regulator with XRE-family HTH domain
MLIPGMTPAQCRAARALLGLTQPQLAREARVGLSTVVDFERARRHVSQEAVAALKKALERTGVEFIDGNGGGAGVRLPAPSSGARSGRRKKP